ncbi:hypothetical protein D3C76_1046120 [compost metagenome]
MLLAAIVRQVEQLPTQRWLGLARHAPGHQAKEFQVTFAVIATAKQLTGHYRLSPAFAFEHRQHGAAGDGMLGLALVLVTRVRQTRQGEEGRR